MPIPEIDGHYSAQVIFKGLTGRPEDVYVNTFYFRDDSAVGTPADVADNLTANLQEFYNVTPTGAAGLASLATRMPSNVIDDEVEVRVYDLGQPSPRYPITNFFNMTGQVTSALPSEVAVCLSYVAGQNQPKQRGRIYVGPLATNVVTVTNGRAVVADNFAMSLLLSYVRLMNKSNASPVLWSPTDQITKEITGCWVDNAFDTQRRRGEIANTRWTGGVYAGQKGTLLPIV
jgi:hypothetical protein